MAEVKVYKLDGAEAGSIKLSDALFAVEVKPELVHEAIVVQDANSRVRYAQVKDRSEVRGGGKKPWKQKGTGRARHGSRRSPIWIGGGITFGPNALRSFVKKMNKKARRKALAMVLSDKVATESLIVVDSLALSEGKAKEVAVLRSVLPGSDKRALMVTATTEKESVRAIRNVERTTAMSSQSLNVRDIAKAGVVIISKAGLEEVSSMYSA